MFEIATPMPPADFEINAQLFKVSEIPSMLSDFIVSKKHDDICGLGNPALKRVGVAWVNFRCAINIASVDATSNPHQHVLRPLHHAAVDSKQVTPLQRLETEVVIIKVTLVVDGSIELFLVLADELCD